jgi:hypothetical protein
VQRLEPLLGRNAGPDRAPATLLELTDAGKRERQPRMMHRAQSRRHVFGLVPVHFADEAQSEVQLLIVLPTRILDAAHGREQLRYDRRGRAGSRRTSGAWVSCYQLGPASSAHTTTQDSRFPAG